MRTVLAAVAALALLMGCAAEKTTSEVRGEVDGCTIIKVMVKGEVHPIFVVKCKDACIASATYETGGKGSHHMSATTIVEREAEIVAKKRAALEKLTKEERQLLGLE